jgi:hypothetical protein
MNFCYGESTATVDIYHLWNIFCKQKKFHILLEYNLQNFGSQLNSFFQLKTVQKELKFPFILFKK